MYGDEKHFTDFNLEGMPYDNLRELVRKLVHAPVSSLYYCKVGKTLKQGLCCLENDADVQEFLKAGDYESSDSSDAYCSSDDEQPILGMRYDHPEQLKLALAKYGVADGYQLWFQKNDWRELLVYCGRDVSTGRCAWYHSKKVKAKKQLFTESHDDANKGKKPTKKQLKKGHLTFKVGNVKTRSCKVGEGISKDGEGSSKNSDVSPKWTKSKIASSRKSGQPICGFRLWASWMSTENSFQIKPLKAEHKCARNYNLGSLVTYKWISHYFAKEIIVDPFIPLLTMKAAIREKFLIHLALGNEKEPNRGGELLTSIGRDANNQMYYIAWAVVKVDNAENWCWFLSLLVEDLELGHGTGITIISDSHKRLFWITAGTIVESIFYNNMDQIKANIPEAYTYLVERNPNSWSRAFFDLNPKYASFENGIGKSFNRAIAVQRTKPIITMLEDIRLYIMQRLVEMKIKC
nr:splicing factor [Tanacetum cinerariifolium]